MGFLGNLIIKIKGDNKDLDKKLKGSEKSVNKFSQTIKKLGGLIAGAFAVRAIVNFGKEVVGLASKAEGVRTAFAKLGDPNLLANLRSATRGTVDDLTLMQKAVQAKNFNIPLDQLATYFKFATNRAIETGESVDYLVDSIITGIGRKSVLVMDNLGISAVELQEETKRLGDFGAAAGAIISRSLDETGAVADTTAIKLGKINTQWQNMKERIGAVIIESGAMQKVLLALEAAFIKVFSVLFPDAADDMKTMTMLQEEGNKELEAMQFRLELIKGIEEDINKRKKLGLKATASQTNNLERQRGFYENHAERLREIIGLIKTKGREEKKNASAASITATPRLNAPIAISGIGDIPNFANSLSNQLVPMGEKTGEDYGAAIFKGIKKAFTSDQVKQLGEELSQMLTAMVQEFAQVIGDVVGMVFEAIGSGDFSQLGKGVLQSFADFLSQLGQMMIAYGTLLLAFETAALNPLQAIAAGVAAIAIAGLIRGAISNSKSTTGRSTGSYSTNGRSASATPQNLIIEVQGTLKGSDIAISSRRYSDNVSNIT